MLQRFKPNRNCACYKNAMMKLRTVWVPALVVLLAAGTQTLAHTSKRADTDAAGSSEERAASIDGSGEGRVGRHDRAAVAHRIAVLLPAKDLPRLEHAGGNRRRITIDGT